jgi:serine phosphatase RsbU (regulator of sigma subunit)
MYTDGVTDSTGEQGEPLDKDGLLAIARSLPPGSAAEIGPALVARLEAFRGINPMADDETFVVLQCIPRLPGDVWPGSVTQLTT